MKKRVLILHGWGGSDYPHWQSWLAGELAKEYGCVSFLHFSEPNTPKLALWMSELEQELQSFQPNVVICHSLANTLWFHFEKSSTQKPLLEKIYFVAPPSNSCTIEELQEFFPINFQVSSSAKQALLISSDNDPYMTLTEAKALQKELNIPMKIIENGGHLNSDSGYGAWPWIYEELSSLDIEI